MTAEICHSEPKRTIGLQLGPKQVVHNPGKKETLTPKQSDSQAQEKGKY